MTWSIKNAEMVRGLVAAPAVGAFAATSLAVWSARAKDLAVNVAPTHVHTTHH